jgi:hypothetical protein
MPDQELPIPRLQLHRLPDQLERHRVPVAVEAHEIVTGDDPAAPVFLGEGSLSTGRDERRLLGREAINGRWCVVAWMRTSAIVAFESINCSVRSTITMNWRPAGSCI